MRVAYRFYGWLVSFAEQAAKQAFQLVLRPAMERGLVKLKHAQVDFVSQTISVSLWLPFTVTAENE